MLVTAVLVALALAVDRSAPGRTDWMDAAREAVAGQVGAAAAEPAVAGTPRAPETGISMRAPAGPRSARSEPAS